MLVLLSTYLPGVDSPYLGLNARLASSKRSVLFIYWTSEVQRILNICIVSYLEGISRDVLMYFILSLFISFCEHISMPLDILGKHQSSCIPLHRLYIAQGYRIS